MLQQLLRSATIISLLFLCSTTPFSIADSTDPTKLYDLDRYLLPQYSISLSPAIVDNYIRRGTFERLYELRQPVGKDDVPLPSDGLIRNDPVLKLVEFLYYVVPGGDSTLRISTNEQIFGNQLKESTVGKILNELLVPPKTDAELEKNKAKLIKIIEDDTIPLGYVEKISRQLGENLKDLPKDGVEDSAVEKGKKKKESLTTRLKNKQNEGGIEGLWAQVKEIDRELEPLIQEDKKIKIKTEKELQRQVMLRSLARQLYHAQHPDQVPEDPKEASKWPSDDLLSSLESEGIGGIIRAMEHLNYTMQSSSDEARKKAWQETFQELIKSCKAVAENLKEVSTKIKSLQVDIQKIQSKFEQNNELPAEERAKRLKTLLKASEDLKNGIQPYKADAFVTTLLAAIKESRNSNSIYPENLVYHLLLGQAMLKSKGYRATLLEIWKQMPKALSERGQALVRPPPFSQKDAKDILIHKESISTLTKKRYIDFKKNQADFLNEVSEKWSDELLVSLSPLSQEQWLKSNSTSLKKRLQKVTQNPNRSIPLLSFIHTHDKKSRPIFNQSLKKVPFQIGGNGPNVTSSDCCEATFLTTILRFVLNTNDGDDNYSVPDNTRDEVLDFFSDSTDFGDVLDSKNMNRRGRWKALTSNLPMLQYFQEKKINDKTWKFDLRPSVDNLVNLMEYLFGLQNENSQIGTNRLERLKGIAKRFNYDVKVESGQEPELNQVWEHAKLTFFEKGKENDPENQFNIDISPLHCWAYQTENELYYKNAIDFIYDHNFEIFYSNFTINTRPDSINDSIEVAAKTSQNFDEYIKKATSVGRGTWFSWLKDLTKEERESFYHIFSLGLVNRAHPFGDYNNPVILARFSLGERPAEKKDFFPLLFSQPFFEAHSTFKWSLDILTHGITSYFPISLKLLNSMPIDFDTLDIFVLNMRHFIKLKEGKLVFLFPKEYEKDLELVTKRFLLSNPKATDYILQHLLPGWPPEKEIYKWIIDMRDYFQKAPTKS